MYVRHHLSISIQGILNRHKRKKINFFSDENGDEISDKKAREYLKECQQKGYKILPCCGEEECPDFDYFENGCPGHNLPSPSPLGPPF